MVELTPAIGLIGIDVDGTLVGASGEVPARVWEAAHRVRAAGIRLALCSGRPAFGVTLEYARKLDPLGWHVFQNGASIVHLGTGRSLSTPLPAASSQSLIEAARRGGHILELYSDNDYVTESEHAWAREHADLLGIPFLRRRCEELRGSAVRAQWLVAAEDAATVMRSVPAELEAAESSSPIMPHTRFIGLTQRGVSKGSAMRSISAELGIALENIMYVGDSGNDVSALQIVGVPVAMANADAKVLAVAMHVAGDVERAGLIDAFDLALASMRRS